MLAGMMWGLASQQRRLLSGHTHISFSRESAGLLRAHAAAAERTGRRRRRLPTQQQQHEACPANGQQEQPDVQDAGAGSRSQRRARSSSSSSSTTTTTTTAVPWSLPQQQPLPPCMPLASNPHSSSSSAVSGAESDALSDSSLSSSSSYAARTPCRQRRQSRTTTTSSSSIDDDSPNSNPSRRSKGDDGPNSSSSRHSADDDNTSSSTYPGSILQFTEQDEAVIGAANRISRFMDFRERCASEVLTKLASLGYDKQLAAKVLLHLQEAGTQDDARFAEMFARGQWITRTQAPSRIAYELRMQRVAQEHIDAALASVFGDSKQIAGREPLDEQQEASWRQLVEVCRQRAEATHGYPQQKRRAKLAAWLQRKGHSLATAFRIFEALGI